MFWFTAMRATLPIILSSLFAAVACIGAETPTHVRGADELFLVPTLEQAQEMAAVTGRPMFLMGYSLVDEKSTYTKFGLEYRSSVF